MRFAPTTQGVRDTTIRPALPTADVLPVWQHATDLARGFWARAGDDGAISSSFKQIAHTVML